MTFNDILAEIRANAQSESDKGSRFERLMREFLFKHPRYSGLFENVWLWRDFPFKKDFGDGADIGIDIVAKTVNGEYWAVQCKCYAEDATISKADVDTFLSTSGKHFSDDQLTPCHFSFRLLISTTYRWSDNAEAAIRHQEPPVKRISLGDLIDAPVNWDAVNAAALGKKSSAARSVPRDPRPHQREAIDAAHEHFKANDRGKLIMACGTGKTYTSLKIAEKEVKSSGLVLFLVPSIALLGQTLDEWTTHAAKVLRPMCVCSDSDVSKKRVADDDGGFSVEDLAFPAVTKVDEICHQFHALDKMAKANKGFRVIFSTYQSLPRVIRAQQRLNKEKAGQADFDLVICDEAHRTTGVSANEDERSAFTLVHDAKKLVAKKRIYMTATPRLYNDKAKENAKVDDSLLCSMDDESIYGKEFYRLGFGKAVKKGLLSDYKVLVLTVPEIPPILRAAVTASNGEIKMDDAAKLVGCTNALSKILSDDSRSVVAEDPALMHKAVAFCQNIKASKQVVDAFNSLRNKYFEALTQEERSARVAIDADHVDGTMGAGTRQQKLAWLKNVESESNTCHLLSNVRCLSEGVDVPSLDAILFLSARNSQIDVIQSVGRVMRKAPGKKYGYVIIPVVIPPDMTAAEALDHSDVYNVVWTVLNALRAHDDHFDTEINKIELNKHGSDKIIVDTIGTGDGSSESNADDDSDEPRLVQGELDLRAQIYAKMVKKVGTRRYWSLWAEEVAKIASRHSARLHEIIAVPGTKREEFLKFLASLRENLNPSVSEEEAADMLVQHALTKPVFDAVFGDYDFAGSNIVSKAMQKTVDLLHEEIPERERSALNEFYKSVAERAEGIDNAEGKQRVIYELYDRFFRAAFPRMSEQLGIVYTPVECVDFIINSVEDVLNKEFGQSLTNRNVHVIDPFTGTGTFMTRLLQSGHIKPKDLPRKFREELHANELVLLAYYIASVNIENVYHDLNGGGGIRRSRESASPTLSSSTKRTAYSRQTTFSKIPSAFRNSAKAQFASSSAIRPTPSDRRAPTTTRRTNAIRSWRRRSPRHTQGEQNQQTRIPSTTPISKRSAGQPTVSKTARALSRSSPMPVGSTQARWTAFAPPCRTSSIPSTSSTCAGTNAQAASFRARKAARSSAPARVRRSPSRFWCGRERNQKRRRASTIATSETTSRARKNWRLCGICAPCLTRKWISSKSHRTKRTTGSTNATGFLIRSFLSSRRRNTITNHNPYSSSIRVGWRRHEMLGSITFQARNSRGTSGE